MSKKLNLLIAFILILNLISTSIHAFKLHHAYGQQNDDDYKIKTDENGDNSEYYDINDVARLIQNLIHKEHNGEQKRGHIWK